MKKLSKLLLCLILTTFMILPTGVFAEPPGEPPSGGNGPGGGSSSGGSSSSASYTGATTISSDVSEDGKTYSSSTGGENALLVSGGSSTLNSCSVTKTGDESSESSDFYGTNAAILVYNGATLNITGGEVTTNGSHANGVFAYGTGTINIADAKITTTSNNSGGIMVTGGGTLTATNLTVKTSGNSSAAIRSDRGGGYITVEGGTYETNGAGSPAIYSTANITVKNAELISTASEGVVVEGANQISLEGVKLTDTNTTLNGNSETYKNIFLYQSMSGDADVGNASFSAKDSTITTNKGDTIFVTNTTASVYLENNTIVNNDGDFVRIQTGKWGTSGSNGGNVTLEMVNQSVEGNIVVDSISTLDLSLKSGSVLISSINSDNQAKSLSVSLSSNSVIVLTGDAYITSLSNEVSDNSNIYLNGHKLYVNGVETSANEGEYDGEVPTSSETEEPIVTSTKENNNMLIYIIAGAIVLVILIIVIVILSKKKGKKIVSDELPVHETTTTEDVQETVTDTVDDAPTNDDEANQI